MFLDDLMRELHVQLQHAGHTCLKILFKMFKQLEKTPRTVLACERSHLDHEKARLGTHVEQHFFNHKVSLLVPGCDRLPAELDSALNSMRSFLLVRNLPLSQLLDKEFLEKAVYKGSTYGLSYQTRIDEDNCFALLPNGKLVLSVDKDTYETLGLEGKPSQYQRRPAGRYVVSVDLKDRTMSPGGKGHQRVLKALTEHNPLSCDLLLSQHLPGDESPALQSLLSNHKLSEHRPRVSTHVMTSLPCPTLVTSDLQGEQQSCDPQSFLEWLGAVDAGVTFEDESGGYLSTYECPQPQTVVDSAVRCSVTGLLLPEDIYHLLDVLRRSVLEPKLAPWLALTVHGFQDSPVSWGTAEHGFLSGGENFYTLVLFQNLDYWICMATGSHDACPP
ncbi:ribonuclease P protein subunit p40-like [Gadus chalcogrammus]|uniref:ribonuclease P protein subunit p40-like n=1 Tax=Gadus chalcogrammus TaxID=1042646 RepID=UPI0024C4C69C|nr:ribonuclease P protein subunit p40-like [Gadus chalcogrammus]